MPLVQERDDFEILKDCFYCRFDLSHPDENKWSDEASFDADLHAKLNDFDVRIRVCLSKFRHHLNGALPKEIKEAYVSLEKFSQNISSYSVRLEKLKKQFSHLAPACRFASIHQIIIAENHPFEIVMSELFLHLDEDDFKKKYALFTQAVLNGHAVEVERFLSNNLHLAPQIFIHKGVSDPDKRILSSMSALQYVVLDKNEALKRVFLRYRPAFEEAYKKQRQEIEDEIIFYETQKIYLSEMVNSNEVEKVKTHLTIYPHLLQFYVTNYEGISGLSIYQYALMQKQPAMIDMVADLLGKEEALKEQHHLSRLFHVKKTGGVYSAEQETSSCNALFFGPLPPIAEVPEAGLEWQNEAYSPRLASEEYMSP